MRRGGVRAAMAAILVALLGAACGDDGDEDAPAPRSTGTEETLSLTSPAFRDGETIPRQFTCDGANVSPPLAWSDVPVNTQELALTVNDPDAPGGGFVHWVAWGIDPAAGELGEGVVAPGMVQGANGAGVAGYTGPCPPDGPPHRYVFTLYAVSEPLTIAPGASEDELVAAIAATRLSRTQLTGTYGRT